MAARQVVREIGGLVPGPWRVELRTAISGYLAPGSPPR